MCSWTGSCVSTVNAAIAGACMRSPLYVLACMQAHVCIEKVCLERTAESVSVNLCLSVQQSCHMKGSRLLCQVIIVHGLLVSGTC